MTDEIGATFTTAPFEGALHQVEERVGRASLLALHLAADLVKENAGSRPSPLSPMNRTGTLTGSIETEGPVIGFGQYRMKVGPTAVYTRITELGHRKTGHRPGPRRPHPFFQPAVDQSVPQFPEVFAKVWRDAIDR